MNRSETLAKILESGVDLLSQGGFSSVTMGGLADRVGMSKSGLFAHFRSKEAVQIALLNETTAVADRIVVTPALAADPGLPRLRALVYAWLGWSSRAGLSGGCPIAAALFELDDLEGPVREHAKMLERFWRTLLKDLVLETISAGKFRGDIDVEQFVFELCGLYLSHHVSRRFLGDQFADQHATEAFEALITRAS